MWRREETLKYKVSEIQYPENAFSGIVYLSIDFGLIWSKNGTKYPFPGDWVWCTPKPKCIINYVDKLWSSGFVPVLYGVKASEQLADEVLAHFKVPPPIFIGIELDSLHSLITESWIEKTNKVYNLGISFSSNDPRVYRMGPDSKIGTNVELRDIGIDWKDKIDSITNEIKVPYMLLLVGQPGAGKTTIANELRKDEWIVIDEKEANSIRRSSKYPSSGVMARFLSVLDTLTESKLRGIVIDATNASKCQREVFITIAKEKKIPYRCGFISRPGYFWNLKRQLPVPEIVYRIYNQNFVEPGQD